MAECKPASAPGSADDGHDWVQSARIKDAYTCSRCRRQRFYTDEAFFASLRTEEPSTYESAWSWWLVWVLVGITLALIFFGVWFSIK